MVELSAQHLEKKVESRRPSISPFMSTRGRAKHITNDSGEAGGGRFVRGNSTPKGFSKGAFPNGDPNHGLQDVFAATWIDKHQKVDLGLLGRADMLLRSEGLAGVCKGKMVIRSASRVSMLT